MKKPISMFMMALLIISAAPLAYAEEATAATTNVELLDSAHGKNLRLLHLERVMTKLLLRGEAIVEKIEETYPDADTTDLHRILDEFAVLIEEVQELHEEEDKEVLAEKISDIIQEARELVQLFKRIVHSIVSEDDRDVIRDAVKDVERDDLADIDERIKDARCAYNAERLDRALAHFGAANDELVDRVRTCDARIPEVKDYLRDRYAEMTDEERDEARAKLHEAQAKRRVAAHAVVDRITPNQAARLSVRKQVRSDKVADFADRAREHDKPRIANALDRRSDTLERQSDRLAHISVRKMKMRDAMHDANDRLPERMPPEETDEASDEEEESDEEDANTEETDSALTANTVEDAR